jgi:hypothetical protein
MKSHSQSRNSRRHPGLLPRIHQVLGAVHGSLVAGCARPFSPDSSPAAPDRPNQSLAKHNRKPIQPTENKRQPPESSARFCCVFRGYPALFQAPRNRRPIPQLTAHQARITPHESLSSLAPSHGIIMLSYAQRVSLIENTAARPARQATGAARNRLRPAVI